MPMGNLHKQDETKIIYKNKIMTGKSTLGIGLLLIIFTGIGAIGYQVYQEYKNPQTEEKEVMGKSTTTFSEEDFSIAYEYLGDNLWTYTITGELPNNCYKISTTTNVQETTATITSTIKKTQIESTCTEEIQLVSEVGEFNAPETIEKNFIITQ